MSVSNNVYAIEKTAKTGTQIFEQMKDREK